MFYQQTQFQGSQPSRGCIRPAWKPPGRKEQGTVFLTSDRGLSLPCCQRLLPPPGCSWRRKEDRGAKPPSGPTLARSAAGASSGEPCKNWPSLLCGASAGCSRGTLGSSQLPDCSHPPSGLPHTCFVLGVISLWQACPWAHRSGAATTVSITLSASGKLSPFPQRALETCVACANASLPRLFSPLNLARPGSGGTLCGPDAGTGAGSESPRLASTLAAGRESTLIALPRGTRADSGPSLFFLWAAPFSQCLGLFTGRQAAGDEQGSQSQS